MQETLYRPHAADGTHYCDNKDRIGWIKGSTLDDLTNKVHGTLDLEPVNVDFDANEFGVASIFFIGIGFVAATIFYKRKAIAQWFKEKVTPLLKHKRHNKKEKYTENKKEAEEANIIIYEDVVKFKNSSSAINE